MPLYVRKSRKGDWDRVAKDTPEEVDFPANVLADLLDNENEISVWEVSDPPGPEIDTIVAALHSRGVSNLSDVTLRVISGWMIKDQLGLGMKQTKGDSLDSKLNGSGKHWVVRTDTVRDVIKLAKGFTHREAIFHGKAQVMRAFASSLAAGRISSDAIQPALLKRLFEDGYLQLVVQQT